MGYVDTFNQFRSNMWTNHRHLSWKKTHVLTLIQSMFVNIFILLRQQNNKLTLREYISLMKDILSLPQREKIAAEKEEKKKRKREQIKFHVARHRKRRKEGSSQNINC